MQRIVETCALSFLISVAAATLAIAQPAPPVAALFEEHCATCHAAPVDRTPDVEALRTRTRETILAALGPGGVMATQGAELDPAQRQAVAAFLAPAVRGAAVGAEGFCATSAGPLGDPASLPRWNGWGNDLSNSRFQPDPGLSAADVSRLTLRWAFGVPGGNAAYAHPTIASGRVFLGSDIGMVYALDAASGCIRWAFKADRGVRTAVSIGLITRDAGRRHAAFFGDLAANVYALDAETGEALWKAKADTHSLARITGAPAFHEGRLYVPVSSVEEASAAQPKYACCTFRGSIVAYDASTGEEIWKTYTIAEEPREVGKTSVGTPMLRPAGAAVWNSPAIDPVRGALYFGTGNAYTEPAAETSDAVMALDMQTGRVLWVNQITPADAFVMNCRPGVENCPDAVGPDYDFGNSPILRSLPNGRRILVIGQKSGVGFGLDPDENGRLVWEYRAGRGSALGGMEWGSAADTDRAYFPVSDVLRPPAESGGLHAVSLATGERVWHTPAPPLSCTTGRACTGAQSAPVSVMPGVVFSGSMDGHFRAYSATDGRILWEYNTAREFETVNGVPARGGSIDSAGPAIAGGLVITPSGYALFRGAPGNVILAFGVE